MLLALPQEPAAPRTVLVFGDSGHALHEPSGGGIRGDLLDFLASWVALVAPPSPAAAADAAADGRPTPADPAPR